MLRCTSKLVTPLVRIPMSKTWDNNNCLRLFATVNVPLSHTRSLICFNKFYNVTPGVECSQRTYASSSDCKPPLVPKGVKKVFYTSVGLIIITIGGVVVYAKQDPEFRKSLDSYVPGSNKFIAIVYQEPGSFSLEDLKDIILNLPNDIIKELQELTKQLLQGLSIEKLEEVTKSLKESISSTIPSGTSDISPKDEKAKASKDSPDTSKSAEPVLQIGNEALDLYKEAINLLDGKENNLADLIDKAVEENDMKLWNDIRKQIDEQRKGLEDVQRMQNEAEELTKNYLAEKKSLLSKVKLPEGDLKELTEVESKLVTHKKKLQSLKTLKVEGATNYFNKIESGRKHLLEELHTLFPGIKLSDQQPKLKEDELDLFLYYAVQKVNYYQKELAKFESKASEKLNKLVQGNPSLKEVIDEEVAKSRRQIKEDFDKKIADLQSGCEKGLQEQMKRQEQVHLDLLNEQLKIKEQEVERKLLQQLELTVQEEKNRLTQELAGMTSRMQALNETISKRALQDMKAQTSQALWSVAEDFYNKLKRSSSDSSDDHCSPTPLAENLEAIRKAAAKGDDLVDTVLATLPATVRDRGVFSEDVLRERFLKVESVAWRVAGIPEGGASLPRLMLSWLQSTLVIRASEPIPSSELKNDPIDTESLNNYDVLQRARYWVDRGNFEQALRYMNLLKGGARSVSLDWIKEVTLLLEAQQAAILLLTHASASGMIYS